MERASAGKTPETTAGIGSASRERGRGRRSLESAHDAALRILARRPHARLELARKLSRRGFETAEIEAALERLARSGYVDDRSFAESLVRRRAAGRGRGAIAAELAARGLGRDVAQAALADLGEEAELEAAAALIRRWRASGPAAVAKAAARLGRRGFAAAVVHRALRNAAEDPVEAWECQA